MKSLRLNGMEINLVVISLAQNSDRRRHIAHELSRQDVSFCFCEAVDGSRLGDSISEYASIKRHLTHGYDLTRGEIGCFLSHRKVWVECAKQQNLFLVLEDDAQFVRDLSDILECISRATDSWDFFRLSGVRTKHNWRILRTAVDHGCIAEDLTDPRTTTAYIITPRGANLLLKYSSRFAVPVDNFIELRYKHGLKILSLVPYPVVQARFATTIQGRSRALKPFSIRLRRLVFRFYEDLRRFLWGAKRYLQVKVADWG